MNALKDDISWASYGVTPEFLEEQSEWLKEGRKLHSIALRFFETAASLIRFARYDYALASAAFFHGVLGLERALKLHFRVEAGYLGPLLERAIESGAITEAALGESRGFSREFSNQVARIVGKESLSRLECLTKLLPALRNDYFHGIYLLAPDYLHLTFQLRRMADALNTKS